MATQHKITALRSGCQNGMDWEAEYEIAFSYTPGAAPIIYPADNADPGYPAEVEFVSINPGAGDHGAFSDLAQQDLEDWASDWLAENEADAIDRACGDIYADEDAREEARNNGQFGAGA